MSFERRAEPTPHRTKHRLVWSCRGSASVTRSSASFTLPVSRRGFRSHSGLWSDGSSSSRQVQTNTEANQAGQNQVDGHEVAQQPWNNQDEDSNHDRNDCMQVSDADVHGSILLSPSVLEEQPVRTSFATPTSD